MVGIPRAVERAMGQFGDNLRTWRQLRRLTIDQVADRAGVGRKTVMSVEAGRSATLESVFRIARALGLLDQLATAVDPYESDVGRLRADEVLPQRVHHRRDETS